MKILVDIKDEKASFLLELLENFKFLKAKPISPYSAEILEGLKESVEEVNKLKSRKKKGQSLRSFLNEV
jgi:hypothetical protein